MGEAKETERWGGGGGGEERCRGMVVREREREGEMGGGGGAHTHTHTRYIQYMSLKNRHADTESKVLIIIGCSVVSQ